MTRKATVVIAVCAVLLGLSMAGASFIHTTANVPIVAAVVAQAVPMQAGGYVQSIPQFSNVNSQIHVSIGGGGPLSGGHIAYEIPSDGAVYTGPPHRRSIRAWVVELHNGGLIAQAIVTRTEAPEHTFTWTGNAAAGPAIGIGGGAMAVNTVGGVSYAQIPLNGADFNCSGTGQFVGNPAFGGGGNITISVSP